MKPRTELRRMSAKRQAKLEAEGKRVFSTLTPSAPSRSSGTRTGMMRRSSVKPRNAKRREREFARCYGSEERVAWVKTLGCVGCELLGVNPECAKYPRENAHTGKKPGKGLKSHHTTIVPLGRPHHRAYDKYEAPFELGSAARAALEARAPEIEAEWRRELFADFTHLAGRGGDAHHITSPENDA